MKSKAISLFLVPLSVLLLAAQGCDDSETQVDARYHAIAVQPNDDCRIDVKAQEMAGEQVLATLTLLKESVEIASVTYNGKPCGAQTEGGGIPRSSMDLPCPMRMCSLS